VRHLALICLTPLILTACSEKPVLSVTEKARYTVELLADRPECQIFSERLLPPVTDEKLVTQTYQAAKAAHCLKPSV
jgi:hypothetical protein